MPNNKNILYITVKQDHYIAKYKSQVKAWQDLGYSGQLINLQSKTEIQQYKLLIEKADLIYIRLEFSLIKCWNTLQVFLHNKKYVVEIPTPLDVYFEEIKSSISIPLWKKNTIILWWMKQKIRNILSNSQLIIEFAEEKLPLVLQYKSKIFLWQNGINIQQTAKFDLQVNQITINNYRLNNQLNMIMVANLADYHGLDRLLNGIASYYATTTNPIKIQLTIISPHNRIVQQNLELTTKLGLEQHVSFLGAKNHEELSGFYYGQNIAIGPIASYQKNLLQASSLKVREYAFFGLPIIIDHHDYDLSTQDFALHIESNSSSVECHKIINFYEQLIDKYEDKLPFTISEYAKNHLTWNHKIKKLNYHLKNISLL